MENKEIWRHSLTFIVVLRTIQYWNKCFICYQDPKLELLADVVPNMTPKLFRVILSCRLAVCPNSECTYPVQSRLICLKISYKKLYFFQVSDAWFKHFQFDSEYDSAGELEGIMKCHYTNEKGKKGSIKIAPLITMKYDINMKYEIDLALKLLRENGWFSLWSSLQISRHTYLIYLLNLRIYESILRELLEQWTLASN